MLNAIPDIATGPDGTLTPESLGHVVTTLEASLAHNEFLHWRHAHLPPVLLEDVPDAGRRTIDLLVDRLTGSTSSGGTVGVVELEKMLAALDAPGDCGERARRIKFEAIRKAARAIHDVRGLDAAASYLEERLIGAPLGVDTADEVERFRTEHGGGK